MYFRALTNLRELNKHGLILLFFFIKTSIRNIHPQWSYLTINLNPSHNLQMDTLLRSILIYLERSQSKKLAVGI